MNKHKNEPSDSVQVPREQVVQPKIAIRRSERDQKSTI